MKCQICKADGLKELQLVSFRKNIYGCKWNYMVCEKCGCFQIKSIPKNISDFYDESYESFSQEESVSIKDKLFIMKREYEISGKPWIGKIINSLYPYGDYTFLQVSGSETNILDIGCGYGLLLSQVKKTSGGGYLDGIDPYMNESRVKEDGVRLFQTDIFSYNPEYQYDIIMMNHSFEHMESPEKVLTEIRRLLKPKGILSIEIPVMNSFLWEKYGTYMDTLDPPLHFYLHTKESMQVLLKNTGYRLMSYRCNVSPGLDNFAERAKAGKAVQRGILETMGIMIGKYRERKTMNSNNIGNIGRFICTIDENNLEG